jgi:hypothetical protein
MDEMHRRDVRTSAGSLAVVSHLSGRNNDVNQIEPNAAATPSVSVASISYATTSAPIEIGRVNDARATPDATPSLCSRTIDPNKRPLLRVPYRRSANPRSGLALSRAASRFGLLLLTAVFLAVVPTAAVAKDTVAFTIKDARITESSGLAADAAGNLYWTVNGSDDGGVAYGIGPDGTVEGTLNFNAQPRDVEAVAVHGDRLYVADIGDNNARRRFVRIYVFANPSANGQTVSYHAYDFRYPDGPQDAETLLINDSGRLFIVTKGQKAGIYKAPAKPERQGVNELEQVGSAPSTVTDGTFLPGGDRIALLTRSSVEVIDASSYEVMASAPIPDQPQAESLSLSLDESSLLVGSEGKKSKVYSVSVPSDAGAKNNTGPGAKNNTGPGAKNNTGPGAKNNPQPGAPFTPGKPANKSGP